MVKNIAQHTDFPDFTVYNCRVCRTTSTYPDIDDSTISQFYAGQYSNSRTITQADTAYFESRAAAQFEMIGSALAGPGSMEGLRVLDIGCGPGCLLEKFESLGADVVGYDPDPKVVDLANERIVGGDVVCNVFDPDQAAPDQRFDVITMSHVLEHIVDPVGFLSKLKAITTPNGILFVEVPYDPPKYARSFFEERVDNTGHLNFFDVQGLRVAYERSGFEVIKAATFGLAKRQHFRRRGPDRSPRVRVRDKVSDWILSKKIAIGIEEKRVASLPIELMGTERKPGDEGVWIRIVGRSGHNADDPCA